jgi:HicB-like protein involved in pilus formation
MDLTQHVDSLRRDLAVAAEAGGEDARALAERLVAPLESALRLTLLSALSAAADEITSELAPGSVHVRLRGGEPDFVVTPPPTGPAFDEQAEGGGAGPPDIPPSAPPEGDEGAVSRINLRLPESLKARVEEAAATAGLSTNAWLVRAAASALERDDPTRLLARSKRLTGQRYTGWVR